MPQLRSFSSFAGTPGIGAAYVGGAKVAQDAISDAARISVERQKLSQDSIQANMRAQAQAQELQQKALMQSHELAVQRAYQQSMIGLRERELGNEQQRLDMEASQAAQQFQAQESMRREVEAAIASGGDVQGAFRNSLMKYGTTGGAAPSMMGDIIQSGPGGANAQMGEAALMPVEGTDAYDYFQTGPRSRTLVPRKADVPLSVTDIPGAEGYQAIGNKVVRKVEPQAVKDLRADKKRLQTYFDGTDSSDAKNALSKQRDGKKLNRFDQQSLQEYLDKQMKLKEIEAALARGGGGKTNQVGRFKIITD